MATETQAPLSGYHRSIGGSAGPETHGGDIGRPAGMPEKKDADYVVSNKSELLEHSQEDNVTLYVEEGVDTIDLTGVYGHEVGSGIEVVAGFCDPNRTEHDGQGTVFVQDYYNPKRWNQPVARTFVSRYGEAPTFWGVRFQGPTTKYFDPEVRVDESDYSTNVKDWYATAIHVYDDKGTAEFIGCEFYGWTMAGVEMGSRNHETDGRFYRCTFRDCMMESLGYGVEQYNGTAVFDRCFFDSCRHAISGFGYPDEEVIVKNSVVGPGPWCGHALDMHCLDNNLHNGDKTAGKRFLIENCTIMSTWDISEYAQEGFAGRGEPADEYRIENTHFFHESRPQEVNKQGNAYRQEMDRWTKFYVSGNIYGPDASKEGVGAPKATKDTPENSMELTVRGTGRREGYVVTVLGGEPKPTGNIESNDEIVEVKKNQYEIRGQIVGADDTYEIPKGAHVHSAQWKTRIQILLDGEDISGQLAGVYSYENTTDNEKRVKELRERFEELVQSLKSLSP